MAVREIITYKDKFLKFYYGQDGKVQRKIEYVLDLVRHEKQVLDLVRHEKQVPIKFFKLLKNTNKIYEVRVITAFKSIRILCFQDEGNLVVLTNCFIKKSQKTPKKEIKIAERLKKEYLREKND